MSAVIYDTENTHVIKSYKTLSAAKAALTRAHNTGSMRYMCSFGYGRMGADRIENLCACTTEYFNTRVDYMVEVKSLMSDKMVKIRRSAQGGCTDPSTERYWSM